ncbi:hypothetical protein BH20ACT5_BH20ACT5_15770 [soil metagenome]
MTTTEERRATGGEPRPGGDADTPRVHVLRGAVLLVGAVASCALLPPLSGALSINWIGPVIGLTFILAGVVSGRVNSLLATGLVTFTWGMGIVLGVDRPFLTVALGVGALLAAMLGDRGMAISRVAVAAPVIYVGLGIYLHGVLDDNLTFIFAAVTALRGLWEFVLARRSSDVHAAQPA